MTLPSALGANLWMVSVAVPLAVGWAFLAGGEGGRVGLVLAVAFAGPILLWAGAKRRSSGLLLVAFPAAIVLPQLLARGVEDAPPEAPFVLVGASLVAYLVAAARGLERAEGIAAPAGVETVSLGRERLPERLKRRIRVYRGLTALTALLPLVLLWHIDLRRSTVERFAGAFGERADAARTLVTLGAGLLTLAVFHGYLLAPLETHLSHDRDVLQAIEADRKLARRGRPRAVFYLWVAGALAAALAVVWRRTH